MITFAEEKMQDVLEEIQPLLAQHWSEIAVYKNIPLDPDYDLYRQADTAGFLVVYTAREEETKKLVGYSIFFLRRHHHYINHTWAMNDIVWIHPDFRQQGFGREFVAFWNGKLRERGTHVVHVNAKVAHPALAYLLKSTMHTVVEAGYELRLN
jgi:GNAT superfamily N-acetyltransferase